MGIVMRKTLFEDGIRVTHAAVGIQKTPAAILNERLRIFVNGFHNLGPVQALDAFSVFNVTRTAKQREEAEFS